jgi:hypothetical protein
MPSFSVNRVLMSALVFLALSFYSSSNAQKPPKIAGNAAILSDMQQPVPPEVQKIIDETMSGGHLLGNFEGDKVGWGFDSSTHLSDLKAGRPFPVYKVVLDSLKKFGENAPLDAITKRIDVWEVPVLLKGKCVTTFEVAKWPKTHKWGPGVFNGCTNVWQKVRNAWPDSMGYHPVKVFLNPWKPLFHIPEQDDNNLTPIYRHVYDSLESAADTSYKILVPKAKMLRYQMAHMPAPKGAAK